MGDLSFLKSVLLQKVLRKTIDLVWILVNNKSTVDVFSNT